MRRIIGEYGPVAAVALTASIVGGGFVAWWDQPARDVGNLAEWAAAIFTGLAFTAGLWVLNLQRRATTLAAENHELERQLAAEERELRLRSQASRVSLSVYEDDPPLVHAETGAEYVKVVVTNGSEAPIFAVALSHLDTATGTWVKRLASIGGIAAGATLNEMVPRRPGLTCVDLGFTDSETNHWVRRYDGELVQVPWAAGADVIGVPAQAFDLARELAVAQRSRRWREAQERLGFTPLPTE